MTCFLIQSYDLPVFRAPQRCPQKIKLRRGAGSVTAWFSTCGEFIITNSQRHSTIVLGAADIYWPQSTSQTKRARRGAPCPCTERDSVQLGSVQQGEHL